MLIQFSVENYKSIRDELVINFRADRKYAESAWAVAGVDKGAPVYKAIGLVGPNASGKSNIIEAFRFALEFIDETIMRKDNAEIQVQGFAFSEEYKNKPTSFEFIFVHSGVKYIYGFSITTETVVEEYLIGYFSAKPKTLFERSEGQVFDFKGNQVKRQRELQMKTNANRLYMPVAAEWGYEPFKPVMEWFNLLVAKYTHPQHGMMYRIGEIVGDEKRKEIFLQELRKADFNIVDIYVTREGLTPELVEYLAERLGERIIEYESRIHGGKYRKKIMVVHRNNAGQVFEIELDKDSAGTQDIVKSVAELMCEGENGGMILQDELGASYHTKLTEHFLSMVQSEQINLQNAQLLFSSHDTRVLQMLNHDQVYLVDKDNDGATFVTLLDDYQIRTDTNVELGYLKGRFGAIPYIKE